MSLSDRILADSIAGARTDSIHDAQRVALYAALTADSSAIASLQATVAEKDRALAAVQRVGRKGLIAKVTPYIAVAGVAYIAGSLDIP